MSRQLERLESYPEVAALPRRHHAETEAQIQRLEGILPQLGASPSAMKDLATQMSANVAALGHTLMADEIMKNHFANVAFEAFEQATYRALVAMAQASGFRHHVPVHEATLREKAFSTLLDMTGPLTARFLQPSASGGQAKR